MSVFENDVSLISTPLHFSITFDHFNLLKDNREQALREKIAMTLTKAQIIDTVQDRLGFTRQRSAELVGSLLEIVKDSLENGDDVLISGFGKFCVKEKKERRGRNPATGEDLMLDERKVVTFKCSQILRDRLNGRR